MKERGGHLESRLNSRTNTSPIVAEILRRRDEALRIRVVGDKSFVTYKGPKLDKTTKTRREIELPLDPADRNGSQFCIAACRSGFTPVTVVRKRRAPFNIQSIIPC